MGAVKKAIMEEAEHDDTTVQFKEVIIDGRRHRIYQVSHPERIAMHKYAMLHELDAIKAFQFLYQFHSLDAAQQDHVFEQCELLYYKYKDNEVG